MCCFRFSGKKIQSPKESPSKFTKFMRNKIYKIYKIQSPKEKTRRTVSVWKKQENGKNDRMEG
jgi:hypothetical protein